jgi:para-aminobenzoate synthetase / 4-amino-4-deoxychorismate lyase
MSAFPHADPGRGVFETMLVIAGRTVELDAHLGRLSMSVERLYGCPLPKQTLDLVVNRAARIECGKLRLTIIPTPGAPRTTGTHPRTAGGPHLRVDAEDVEAEAIFPGPERAASLRSAVVAGGLGEHKWADRDLLDRLVAASPGELPLLLDADGAVLEASRASIFAVAGGRLLTPPTDGRILPSIARQQVIEVASAEGVETGEERLVLADLLAHEVFLAGSVRGIEPARTLDGAELAPPGEVSGRIAGGLRRRWRVPAAEPVAAVASVQPGGRPGH